MKKTLYRAAVARGFSSSAAKGLSSSARASSFKGISGAAVGGRPSGVGGGEFCLLIQIVPSLSSALILFRIYLLFDGHAIFLSPSAFSNWILIRSKKISNIPFLYYEKRRRGIP